MEKINNIHENMFFVGIYGSLENFQLLSGLDKTKQRQNVFKFGETTTFKTCSFKL